MRLLPCSLATLLALAACEPLLAPGFIAPGAGNMPVHVSSDPDVSTYHLVLSDYPPSVVAGTAFGLTIQVRDASGQRVNYAGTLHFTGSDPQSALPPDQPITAGELIATDLVLKTAAVQSISVSDPHAPGLTGAPASVQVQAAATAALQLSGFPDRVQAGQASPLTVRAVDVYGNPAAAAGVVHFTSTDPQALVPADVTLQNGAATSAPGALLLAGAQAWAAQTLTGASLAGQQTITVTAGAVSLGASSLTASPTAVHNNTSSLSTLTCTLRDAYGNAVAGTPVAFTSPNVVFAPASVSTGANGQATSLAHSGNMGYRALTASFGAQSLSTKVGFYGACGGFSLASTNVANSNNAGRAQSVAMGDINGDGAADLAVANYSSSNVTLLINQGAGNFALGAPNALPAGNGANAVVLADLDLDGDLDLATADWRASTMTVFDGLGNGNFVQRAVYSTGSQPVALVVADLNGDGRPDLAAANQEDTTVTVYLAAGKGLLPGLAINQAVSSNGLAAGDIDDDGDIDLLTASYGGDVLTVLRNTGNGTAYARATYPVPSAYWVALGDLNGDGKLDVAVPIFDVLNPGTQTTQDGNQVAVLLNAGNGAFSAATNYTVNSRPVEVAMADLDLDGHLDLIVTSNTVRSTSVLLGNGNGTFKAQSSFATTADYGYGLAVGDLSGDGRADVVVTHDGTPSSCSVYINPCN